MSIPENTASRNAAASPATAGRRLHHRQIRATELIGRAWIGYAVEEPSQFQG